MLTKPRRLAMAMFMLWFGFRTDSPSRADLQISTPAGLTAGDTFRIVFVTDSTTNATSTSISYYNGFVTADATAEAGAEPTSLSTTAPRSRGPRSLPRPRKPPSTTSV